MFNYFLNSIQSSQSNCDERHKKTQISEQKSYENFQKNEQIKEQQFFEQSEQQSFNSEIIIIQPNIEQTDTIECPNCYQLINNQLFKDHNENSQECLQEQLKILQREKKQLKNKLEAIEKNVLEKFEDLQKYTGQVLQGQNYFLTIYENEINQVNGNFSVQNWFEGLKVQNLSEDKINNENQIITVSRSIHIYKLGKSIVKIKIDKMKNNQMIGFCDQQNLQGYLLDSFGNVFKLSGNKISKIEYKNTKFNFKEGDMLNFCYKPFEFQISIVNQNNNCFHIFGGKQVYQMGSVFMIVICFKDAGDSITFISHNNKK